MQNELDKADLKKYEVINAGIPGASLMHIFINYSLIWRQLEPDIVIIEYNVDEVPRNILPFSISENFNAFDKCEYNPKFFGALHTLFAGLFKLSVVGKKRFDHPNEDGNLRFRTLLENVLMMVKASGAKPILLTYESALSSKDSKGAFSEEFLDEIFLFYQAFFFNMTFEGAMKTIDVYNGIIREVAENNQVTLVETVGIVPREDKYFLDGNHHTQYGSAIIAKTIVKRLREDGILF